MSVDLTNAMLSFGASPLELEYYSINTLDEENRTQSGFRTVVRINSPEVGALYPEQYRIVSNRTSQCVKLSTWAFNRLISDADRFLSKYSENFFLTVYFPARMILKPDIEKLLDSVPAEKKYIIPHLVFEFSSDILLLTSPELSKKLEEIKSKYGVKLLMSEFGDDFCPILRLNGLPFDYIILDKTVSTEQALSSVNVRSVIQLVKNNSMICILENTGKRGFIETAIDSGCALFCSNRKTNPTGTK